MKLRFRFDPVRLEELERGFDSMLGGPITRPYRDLLCYCVGRLMANGAAVDSVTHYIDVAVDVALGAVEDGAEETGQEGHG